MAELIRSTRKERVVDADSSEATPLPAVLQATHGPNAAMTRRTPSRPVAGPGAQWDDWFVRAAPEQRVAALALAERQGLLYPHQLPSPANGVKAAAGPLAGMLKKFLTGATEGLPELPAEVIIFADADLDEMQQQAVRRALATPDVCLIQGWPGTGKTRVLAEVVVQAARRGWRVLHTAPDAVPLDALLHRLVGQPDVLPIRCLERGETAESLPPWLRGFTLIEQQQAFLERTLAGARAGCAEAEEVCRGRQRQEATWTELRDLAEHAETLRVQFAELALRQTRVEADLAQALEAAEPGPLTAALAELQAAYDRTQKEIASAQTKLGEQKNKFDAERQALDGDIAQLTPGFQARAQGRWWTPGYWLVGGAVVAAMAKLTERGAALAARRKETDAELARLDTARVESGAKHRAERDAVTRAEADLRREALMHEQHRLGEQIAQAEERGRRILSEIGETAPASLQRATVATAHAQWQQLKGLDEASCRFAQEWVHYLETTGPGLAGRLPLCACLLVGTFAALEDDTTLKKVGACDLLIVAEAERLTETELLKLSQKAARLVLIGAPPIEGPRPVRALVPTTLAPTCWAKLWHALAGDTGRPYSWRREADRLVCQLAPVAPEERRYLETEGLADDDAVELRILNRPRSQPRLAEVAFPVDTPLERAFALIVRELEEVPLAPLCRTAWWHADDRVLAWQCGPRTHVAERVVELEPGLYLHLDDVGRTSRLTFDRAGGWDAPRAQAWIGRHRPEGGQGRTAVLQVPYRQCPSLAGALGAVLHPGDAVDVRTSSLDEPSSLEFVAVPAPRGDWPREGAGLELDLTTPRHGDRLPNDLREGLPARGVVNYLEAQAVVKRLEQIAVVGRRPTVAVLALYEGQAELIRRLATRSEALAARPFPLEIGVPAKWREREAEVVLVSLTRSHSHRAVSFGDGAADLELALTRATTQVIVFGDPGALVKRANWNGPLDHHNAAAAALEQGRITRLVRRVQPVHPAEARQRCRA